MKITIDTDQQILVIENNGETNALSLYSKETFEILSDMWLKVGWNQKYTYSFTWFGRPIIQLPEDLIRLQEVIYRVKPDIIVETGVAHGGSLVYYASLCKAIGKGRVIGVDIEIRPYNRQVIEAHELSPLITLVEGSSVDPTIINKIGSLIKTGETVVIILDSNHTKAHVAAELNAYHHLVTPNSYIIATDGIMKNLTDVPRGSPDWEWNNPATAAIEFAQTHPEFALEQPAWLFNESQLNRNVTHWPAAWLCRLV